MTKLVAGNWKSNGSKAQCDALLDGILQGAADTNTPMIIAPAAPYLLQAIDKVREIANVQVASQNVSAYEQGAYTGEIEASMLKDIGCTHVIIGHSERRTLFGENDNMVARKVQRAYAAGLIPIICVGETLEERESGRAFDVVGQQVDSLYRDGDTQVALKNAIFAYEPVWAIGTGKSASSSDAEEMHQHIRGVVQRHDAVQSASLVILYGGSVKPETAEELFSKPDIGGALVGGASLDAASFIDIARVGAKF